jgi:pimeloyl-ACP methyl ester carboxylesterase
MGLWELFRSESMQEIEKFSNSIHYMEFIPDKIISSPIIFLHGWGSCAFAFAPSMKKFVGKVFAPDLPGFGRTRLEIATWDYETLAKAILAFADSLGLEQFHLVGHSLGGGISMKMCSIAPERIKSLVLVDSAGDPNVTNKKHLFVKKVVENIQQAFGSKFSLYNLLILKAFLYNLVFNSSTNWAALKIPLSEDIDIVANFISARTLLVWGEKDKAIPLEAGIHFSNQIQNSHLIIIKDKFHEWGVLYPQILSDIVNEFIIDVENDEKSQFQYDCKFHDIEYKCE